MHELGVAEDGAGRGEDDEGEEAVVDVAVGAEVLAVVHALQQQVLVSALRAGRDSTHLITKCNDEFHDIFRINFW